ncbi:MAG TPA: radical SAM protein [Desulfobulbus sp.]|nr:radical SAM protein [Desulfobulbus sp.]
MHYEGTVIRPPSEWNSIILQVTVGCSHNRCTFCGAYRDKQFRIKKQPEIDRDLAFAARYCKHQKTVFLADGDALVIPHQQMVLLFKTIYRQLPWVRRISLYANCRDILARSGEQLEELKKLGLGRIYMGLESGHDPTLAAVKKGATAAEMIKAGRRVRRAGLFLSVSCLLGLGGKKFSMAHAAATAELLRAMQPSQIAILTLMLMGNTELAEESRTGRFIMPAREELFGELRALVAGLDGIRAQFQANHASNYFSLDGRLPRDKNKFLTLIDQAAAGTMPLKTENQRAL